MENQVELENNNQPQPPTYTRGLFLNLQQAFGKENLPDEATFTKKITTDKVYRDGVHKNLIAAYGQDNVPDLATFDSKVLGGEVKKKEQPVPTEKPSQVSAKSSQLDVTKKAVPTTSELGVGEEPLQKIPSYKDKFYDERRFVSESTKAPKIITETKQDIVKAADKRKNDALDNTVKRWSKQNNVDPNSPKAKQQRKLYEEGLTDGGMFSAPSFSIGASKDGAIIYRNTGMLDSFANAYDKVKQEVEDAKAVKKMTDDEAIQFLKEKKSKPEEAVPERAYGLAGGFGDFFGGVSRMIAKQETGALAAQSAALLLAPETGGTSLLILGGLGGSEAIRSDMQNQSYLAELEKRYQQGLDEGKDEKEAIRIAKIQAERAGNISAAEAYAFGFAGQGVKKIFSKPVSGAGVKESLGKVIMSSAKEILPEVVGAGATVTASSLAKDISAKQLGYNVTTKEMFDNAWDTASETWKFMGSMMLLHGAVNKIKQLPGYAVSQLKSYINSADKGVPQTILDNFAKNNVLDPTEVEKTKKALEQHAEAKNQIASLAITDEVAEGSISGKQEKKNKLQKEIEELKKNNVTAGIEDKQAQIDKLNKEIEEIYKTGNINEHEFDNQLPTIEPTEVTPEVKPIETTKSISESFSNAGEKAKSENKPDALADFLLSNSRVGDTITDKNGEGFEVTEVNTRKDGTRELILVSFELIDGKKEYNYSGSKLISDNNKKQAGDLYEFSYTNSKGERVNEKYNYNTTEAKPTEVTTTPVAPTEVKTTAEVIEPEIKITIDSESLKKNTQPEVDRVKNLPLENEDGATFNLNGTKHEGGLVVPVESLNTTRAELTPELINDFVEKNKDKISGDNFKVGIYKFPNSENVSIDLNIVVDPKFKDAALEFGKLAGQESLFDLDSFQNIKTGATGENPKSFTPKEFFDIAKSLAKGEVPEVVKATEAKPTEIKAEVKTEPKTVADTVADDLFTHLGIEPEGTEATAPRVYTSENVSELTSEGLKGDQKAAVDSVKNVVAAIDKLVEATTGNKLKVSIYDNQASFTKGVEEYGGSKQDSISKGFYMSEDGTIHINMSRASSETMLHEGFHPVLDYLAANKPEIIDNFHKQLSKIKGGDKIIADAERAYKGMGDTTIKKEAITDFIAKIADPNNPLQLDKTNFEKVKAFVLDMLEKMGLKFDKDIRTIDDLKKLAQVISKKFVAGEEIKVGDKNPNAPSEYISADGKPITNKQAQFSVQNDFSDVRTKVTFTYIENSKDFEKLKKDGYITEDKKLSDFKGKYIFLHSPDNAFTGNISKNGEMLIKGNGGVYYPIRFHKDGYFWASTKTAAESMARQLNTMIEKNGGTIYMALTSAPADKLLSSTTASNAVVDFFSSKAMDKNVGLKESSLKKALLEAVNSVITKEVKVKNKKTGETKVVTKKVGLDLKLPANTSLADLKSILKTKLAADNSIFADRKHFTLQLIRNISKEISGTKSEQVLGRFFKEGILNPEMKGQLKGGEYKMSAANITQALSHMLSEPMLRGQESGKVYAVIEINGKVKPVDSAAHESYPKAIQAVDANNKVKLHILQDRENWNDHFADPETGNIIEGNRKLEVYPTSGVSIEPLLNIGKEKPISQIGGMPEKAAAAPQWSKGQDLIESTGKRKEMTEDDKGNYLFFHYSDKKFNKLSPEKVGTHLATGRDERTGIPTSSLYTRPDRLEPNVPSDFGYITRVPKEKVYSFNADPLNLMAEAEAKFKKENKDRAFDANNQFAYVAKVAAEKGFPVTVAEWNMKGTKALIAKTTEALPLEKYTNIKPGTTNQIEFAKGTEDIKPNAKRRDIKFSKENQDAKIKDFIEMQREKGISDEDIKAGLEKAADRIGLDKNKIDELLTTKKEEYAVQEPSPEGVLQPTQEGAGKERGERAGMEQAEQGAVPPKEGKPSEAEVGGAEKKIVYTEAPKTAAKVAELNRVREEFGLPEFEPTEEVSTLRRLKNVENTIADLKKSGKYEEEIKKIKEKAARNEISDEGQDILTQRLADLRATAKTLDRYSPEYDKITAQIKDVTDTLKAIGTIAGRTLEARKHFVKEIETVHDIEENMLQDLNTDTLTKAEKDLAQQKFDEYQKINEAAEKALQAKNEELAKLKIELEEEKAKNELSKQQKAVQKTTPKTKDDYKKEREAIKQSIKDKWNNAGKDIISMDLPYRKQLAAITPEVSKLVYSYLEQAAKDPTISKKVKDIVEFVKKELKEFGINVSDREALGLVSGEYAEKQQTRNELSKERYELQKEADLLAKIDDLQNDIVKEKDTDKQRKKSVVLKDLEKQLDDLQKQMKVGKYSEEAQFEATAKQQIAANKKKIEEIQQKIKKGDFAPETKKESILLNEELQKKKPEIYNEWLETQVKKEDWQKEYEYSRLKQQAKQLTFLDKAAKVGRIGLTTYRTSMATGEISTVLVQNIMPSINNLDLMAKFVYRAFKNDLLNGKEFKREMVKLKNSEFGDLLFNKMKIALYEPMGIKEEAMNELLGGNESLINKSFTVGGKKYSFGQAFERLVDSYANNLRIELASREIKNLREQGKTWENAKEEYIATGRRINEESGHGKLAQPFQNASKWLNMIIWSTKMMSSTFNVLGMGDLIRPLETAKQIGREAFKMNIPEAEKASKGYYTSLTPRQRMVAARNLGQFAVTGLGIMGVIKLLNKDDDDVKVTLNPFDSNFGIKIGDKQVNPFGRYASYMTGLLQVFFAMKYREREKKPLGVGYKAETSGDVAFSRFVRGKMRPDVGLAYDYVFNNGKNYFTKEKIKPSDLAPAPMTWINLFKDIKRDKISTSLWNVPYQFIGGQVRDQRDFEESKATLKKESAEERNLFSTKRGTKVEGEKRGTKIEGEKRGSK